MSIKKNKNLKLSIETIDLINKIKEQTAINEGQLIELLVGDYAIDLGIAIGEKSSVLSAHAGEGGICQKKEKSDLSSTSINQHFEYIKTMLSFLQNSIKEVEENTYINKDALNGLLLYLKPEEENPDLPSTDTKLSMSNRRNLHPYIAKSIDNRSERIRQAQVSKAQLK